MQEVLLLLPVLQIDAPDHLEKKAIKDSINNKMSLKVKILLRNLN